MSDLVTQLKELDRKLGDSARKPTVPGEQSVAAPVARGPEVTAPTVQESAPVEIQPPKEAAPPQVEKTSPAEQAFEQYKQVDDEHPDESPYVITQAQSAKSSQATSVKSQHLQDIEDIMTEDLGEIYQGLSAEDQAKFKAKGEEVAMEIESLLDRAKFTAKRVLQLIRDWLKVLPGVNRFFLEQEAKIKTEELIHYARRRKHQD